MSNDPCLCGFWGKSHSNKIVSDWYDDCKMKMINWIKIEDEIPEQAKKLFYFFEGTGVWTGFYYGR